MVLGSALVALGYLWFWTQLDMVWPATITIILGAIIAGYDADRFLYILANRKIKAHDESRDTPAEPQRTGQEHRGAGPDHRRY